MSTRKMLGALRKAGEKIRQFDDAYAARVMADSKSMPITQMLGGLPLTYKGQYSTPQEIALYQASTSDTQGPARPRNVMLNQAAERALGMGAQATSAGYRYGLPAAGVTLAGKGLYDLATQFGGVADQPEPATLGM